MENSTNTENTSETEPPLVSKSTDTFIDRFKRALLGAPRDIKDPRIFHRISLIAYLAWVGLGADALSA